MFNGNVGHQEILFTRGVFALFAFERFVVGVGQLVIEQVLLVIAGELTKLTLKPDKEDEKNSYLYSMFTSRVFLGRNWQVQQVLTSHLRAVATVLYVREKMHFESVALLEGFPTLQRKHIYTSISIENIQGCISQKRHKPVLSTVCMFIHWFIKTSLMNKIHMLSCSIQELYLVTHVRFLRAVCLHVLRQAFLHGVHAAADWAWKLGHFGNLWRIYARLLSHKKLPSSNHSEPSWTDTSCQ